MRQVDQVTAARRSPLVTTSIAMGQCHCRSQYHSVFAYLLLVSIPTVPLLMVLRPQTAHNGIAVNRFSRVVTAGLLITAASVGRDSHQDRCLHPHLYLHNRRTVSDRADDTQWKCHVLDLFYVS